MDTILTVRGPASEAQGGPTLPHEHVQGDLVGAAALERRRYQADEVGAVMRPYLITRFPRERGPDRLLLSHDAGEYVGGKPNGAT